jgi:hypothetical protein
MAGRSAGASSSARSVSAWRSRSKVRPSASVPENASQSTGWPPPHRPRPALLARGRRRTPAPPSARRTAWSRPLSRLRISTIRSFGRRARRRGRSPHDCAIAERGSAPQSGRRRAGRRHERPPAAGTARASAARPRPRGRAWPGGSAPSRATLRAAAPRAPPVDAWSRPVNGSSSSSSRGRAQRALERERWRIPREKPAPGRRHARRARALERPGAPRRGVGEPVQAREEHQVLARRQLGIEVEVVPQHAETRARSAGAAASRRVRAVGHLPSTAPAACPGWPAAWTCRRRSAPAGRRSRRRRRSKETRASALRRPKWRERFETVSLREVDAHAAAPWRPRAPRRARPARVRARPQRGPRGVAVVDAAGAMAFFERHQLAQRLAPARRASWRARVLRARAGTPPESRDQESARQATPTSRHYRVRGQVGERQRQSRRRH